MHFILRHIFLSNYNFNKILRFNTDIYLVGMTPNIKRDGNVLPQHQFIAVTVNYSNTNVTTTSKE